MALQHTNPHTIWTSRTFYHKRPSVCAK